MLVMLTSDLAGYVTGCTVEISGGKFCVQNPIRMGGGELDPCFSLG